MNEVERAKKELLRAHNEVLRAKKELERARNELLLAKGELSRACNAEFNQDALEVILVVKDSVGVIELLRRIEKSTRDPDAPEDAETRITEPLFPDTDNDGDNDYTHNTRRDAAITLIKDFVDGLFDARIELGVMNRALKLLQDADTDQLVNALGFYARDDHRPVEDNDERNRGYCDEVRQLQASGMSIRKAFKEVAARNDCSPSLISSIYYEEKHIRERSK